ncbi:hypothetical protein HS7_01430 [Sulfolobales archaeon HS-7]|nr:hypothetical protein HS7_01430 [Sulfolobales archaeon HS-7]
MTIIVRKVHSKGGKHVWMRVGESPPIVRDGRIKEGAFFIVIGDDTGDKSIRLSDEEALDIANRIISSYNSHIREYRLLDKKTYAEYKMKMESEDDDTEENIGREVLEFLLLHNGKSTIEDIRNQLGTRYADSLSYLERRGLVSIKENVVSIKLNS